MSRSPWYLAVGLMLLLLWSGYLTSQASARAAVAEGKVEVLDSLRLEAESRARADSVALEAAQIEFRADSTRLASERAQERRRASEASRVGQEAIRALRASLDLQEGILLDSIEAAHASEVDALEEQLVLADSATVVERSLRLVTEAALSSERAARQTTLVEMDALRAQIAALNRGRRADKLQKAALVVGIVAAATLIR